MNETVTLIFRKGINKDTLRTLIVTPKTMRINVASRIILYHCSTLVWHIMKHPAIVIYAIFS